MKILLAIDVQPEFRDSDGHYERILSYIETHKKDYDAVYATMCGNSLMSPFFKQNVWKDCLDGVKPLDFNPEMAVMKYGYGFTDYSWLNPAHEYEIIGYNTDCCVYKIAMDLFDRGYTFKILTGLCYSSSGAEHHERGIAIMKDCLKPMLV